MKVFNLPDLGEGLPDAEIVEWLVKEGDQVTVDQPMVSMETAKAVVEVPSPYTGRVVKLYGQAGDVIEVDKPLISFEVDGDAGGDESSDEASATAETAASTAAAPDADDDAEASEERADTGTVVGVVESSTQVLQEQYATVGNIKVSPAVRALARKLKVDLSRVTASGADGVVTAADVKAFAASPEAQQPAAPSAQSTPAAQPQSAPQPSAPSQAAPAPQRPAAPTPAKPQPQAPSGEWEPVRGTRRTMARIMSEAHAKVVPTTLMDDADLHAWRPGQDITVRLIRALWAGAQAEPGLNAWYDGDQGMRMIHKGMDVGVAVDTADGLFVPALRNIHQQDAQQLRESINRMRDQVKNRSIPPEDLKDFTIMLSNFGVFAGRYATPVISPPCVAILAAGKLRHEVVPVLGGFEVHRMMPLSLTFDHRACTGGEAARFLRALIDDLAKAE
ncbi:MAG: hypothetical protein Tsb002_30220 [Wenzhouxiangellaceae bacterium]